MKITNGRAAAAARLGKDDPLMKMKGEKSGHKPAPAPMENAPNPAFKKGGAVCKALGGAAKVRKDMVKGK